MGTDTDILIIEDDPSDADIARMAIASVSPRLRLAFADDGENALAWLDAAASGGGVPRLVLLDLNLPRISGLDVLRRMRLDRRLERVPVVVLTSSVREQDRSATAKAGASEYLTKPVSFADFIREIKRIIKVYLEGEP